MKLAAVVAVALAACAPSRPPTRPTHERTVAAGTSIQAAIDACPTGYVLHIGEGVFPERLTIEKPITLIGAGWDKTVIGPDAEQAKAAAQNDAAALKHAVVPPTLTVRSTTDVTLRGLRLRGPAPLVAGESTSDDALVVFDAAEATMSECAVVGPFMNGIAVLGGSDVRIERSLVAAMWGTGIEVRADKHEIARLPARVYVVESDIRNCYHRGMTIRSDYVLVERCRISGSAWHGIRYDDCSPIIRDNQIFGSARMGIYASGTTAAQVRGNVFWRNAMSGVSCWVNNGDLIAGNTFVGNLREGLAVLGAAQPLVVRNVFASNPTAVFAGRIGGEGDARGTPRVAANLFWSNPVDYADVMPLTPLPKGNLIVDPGFVAPKEHDFTLAPGSAARSLLAGAMTPVPIESPFPLQDEEKAIIPDGETRDSRSWKKPASIARR